MSLFVFLPVCALGLFWLGARWSPAHLDQVYAGYQESWRIYDRQGDLLREAVNSRGERAEKILLPRMNSLSQAVVCVEDEGFYHHPGIDVVSLFRALWGNVWSGQPQEGASTISMQLARLVWSHPRNLWGKVGQIFDALRLEAGLSKNQILEAYLTLAPFTPGTQGAGAAARILLGKSPETLTKAEAALLAGLLQAPSDYDPRVHPDKALARRSHVLERMINAGVLVGPEVQIADREAWHGLNTLPPIQAGHFTDWVLSQNPAPGKVSTTLDGGLQKKLEALVRYHVEAYREVGAGNASLVVLDTRDASVLALVGSSDWKGRGDGAVNGVLARQQPGSTLKPFAYALALEKGYTPASILADVETEYYGTDNTLYIPQNYSHSFRGPVTIQEALSSSLNIPAVRLVQALGVPAFLDRLKALGFHSLKEGADYYGLGLVLGNGEVSLLELAGAYGVLARGGFYLKPTPFQGRRFPPAFKVKPVISPLAASLITAILSDDWLKTQTYGLDSPLIFDFPFALKTGTSNNWRDNWVMGYSQEYIIGCWVGNFDDTPTNQLSGAVGAGPLFNKVVRLLASEKGGKLSKIPEAPGIRTVQVCSESGMAPNPLCPRTSTLRLGPGDPLEICLVHRSVKIDRRTGFLARESTPARFVAHKNFSFLPPLFDSWQLSRGRPAPPRAFTSETQEDLALRIQKPRNGDVYLIEPGYELSTQSVPFRVLALQNAAPVTWWMDGRQVSQRSWPFDYDWILRPGDHQLQAVQGGVKSEPVHFKVK